MMAIIIYSEFSFKELGHPVFYEPEERELQMYSQNERNRIALGTGEARGLPHIVVLA